MSTVTADALALIDTQAAQIAALEADNATLSTEKTTALSDRDAAQAQVAELLSQIAALQPPADVNGVPQVVSKKQGRAQLKAEGLLAAVEGYIQSLPADNDTRMAYEDAATWVRTDPDLLSMMTMLGKTAAEADAFFVAASAR